MKGLALVDITPSHRLTRHVEEVRALNQEPEPRDATCQRQARRDAEMRLALNGYPFTHKTLQRKFRVGRSTSFRDLAAVLRALRARRDVRVERLSDGQYRVVFVGGEV